MNFDQRYSSTPGSAEIREFQKAVIDYYRRQGRVFPWRERISPYRTYVSEVMLQQTQTHRVEPKFNTWMDAVPDFKTLAALSTEKLLTLWQGLGYNRRALNLRRAASVIVDEWGGELRNSPDELLTLPGIGPATAASICAFAFNAPVVFIETNIRRVFIHFFFEKHEQVSDKEILPLAERCLYRESPRDWYNGMMDIGTLLKTKVPNPNRRSRHYTKQAAFEGSNRQARGAILKALQGRPGLDAYGLSKATGIDYERILKAAAQLETEGFIAAEGDTYGLRK